MSTVRNLADISEIAILRRELARVTAERDKYRTDWQERCSAVGYGRAQLAAAEGTLAALDRDYKSLRAERDAAVGLLDRIRFEYTTSKISGRTQRDAESLLSSPSASAAVERIRRLESIAQRIVDGRIDDMITALETLTVHGHQLPILDKRLTHGHEALTASVAAVTALSREGE